jgi:hypothetical protein
MVFVAGFILAHSVDFHDDLIGLFLIIQIGQHDLIALDEDKAVLTNRQLR